MIISIGKNRNLAKLTLFIAICFLLLFISACHKTWNCSIQYYDLECIKGTDTIYNHPTLLYIDTSIGGEVYDDPYYSGSLSYTKNLVAYYKANGYTVIEHPLSGGTAGYGVGRDLVKTYEANGWTCKSNGL